MHELLAFLDYHKTIILLGAGWLFSAIASSQPPLSPNASYGATWFHNVIQLVAANSNKLKQEPPPGSNPETTPPVVSPFTTVRM